MKRIALLAGACASILLLSSAAPAVAMQLVEGGFARNQASYTPPALTLNTPALRSPVLLPEIGFTPRHRSFAATAGSDDSLSFRMSIDAGYGRGLDFRPPNSYQAHSRPVTKNLLVGGAIELAEVGLIGGVGRTSLFGERADMFMAGMTFGGLEARLAVGETAQEVQGAKDVMMLSTDLRLAPWISVQGDLALSEPNDEQESLAIGRVGVRLRF